jgi:hypothetical protein
MFEFVSAGKKSIKKRVKFDLIDADESIYNLALCTVLESGAEDCETASNNGDMQKIFETIAIIAYTFTNQYPGRKIYFTGSDNLRTRQYRLTVFSNLKTILMYFDMEGIKIINGELGQREIYQKGRPYDGFILTRKAG